MAVMAQIQVSCGNETISFRSDIGIQYSDNVSFSLIARGCQTSGLYCECKVSRVDIRHGGGAIRYLDCRTSRVRWRNFSLRWSHRSDRAYRTVALRTVAFRRGNSKPP
ncbi:hypothetical protein EMIT0P258_360003 [Pseudomonas sp. IT-P258]